MSSTQQSLHTSAPNEQITVQAINDAEDKSDDPVASLLEVQLLDLSNDSLINIFKSLHFDQLVQLYGSLCQRLDVIINQVCSLKRYEYKIHMAFPPTLTAAQLEFQATHLYSFTMAVGFSVPKADVLRIFRPICSGAARGRKLRAMSLYYFHWDDDYIACLELVAPQLIYLDIRDTELLFKEQLIPVISKMRNLRNLIVNTRLMNRIE